jgi:hypothetical protein
LVEEAEIPHIRLVKRLLHAAKASDAFTVGLASIAGVEQPALLIGARVRQAAAGELATTLLLRLFGARDAFAASNVADRRVFQASAVSVLRALRALALEASGCGEVGAGSVLQALDALLVRRVAERAILVALTIVVVETPDALGSVSRLLVAHRLIP